MRASLLRGCMTSPLWPTWVSRHIPPPTPLIFPEQRCSEPEADGGNTRECSRYLDPSMACEKMSSRHPGDSHLEPELGEDCLLNGSAKTFIPACNSLVSHVRRRRESAPCHYRSSGTSPGASFLAFSSSLAGTGKPALSSWANAWTLGFVGIQTECS